MSKLYRIATSTIAMVFSLSVLTVLGTLNQPVSARQNPQPKVTICHRTDAANNPYVQLSVDKNAVDGFSGNNQGDDHYGEHQGPVAYSTAVAQALKDQHKKWGDIIPPVPGAHNGLNWTTQGQAIYNNDCNLLKGATPVAPQATEPNCEVQSMTVTAPAITGVVWNQTSATLKPGESFTFEATPAAGYTFGPQDQTSWKFTNDFNPERCIEVGPAVIEYKVVCNEEGGIDVTFTNTGESDGEAVLNGEAVNVPAGNSITVSLEDKSQVTIVINDQTVYDQVVTCGGMGGETPETPETPVTSGTVTVAAKPVAKSLPYTAGNQSALIAGVAAATAVVVAILGYAVRFGAKRFQA